MPLENFLILHSNGECVFRQHYAGESLSLSSVLALSSCISMLRAATSKGAQIDDDEDGSAQQSGADGAATAAAAAAAAPAATAGVCSVSVNGLKLVSLDVPCGPTSSNGSVAPTVYTLVAQGNADESDAFLTTYLTDVREVLRAYLGGPPLASALPDDRSAVKAIADILHHLLSQSQYDLSCLVGGVRWTPLEDEVREQLDRAMAGLENSAAAAAAASAAGGSESSVAAAASSNGDASSSSASPSDACSSMLVLGNSILHSRMSHSTSRMLLQHLASRPLGQCKLRTLPLYTEGRWRHFLLLRLRQQQVLVVSAPLRPRTALSRLCEAVLLWEEEECPELGLGLSLPAEEPPVLLRHYTGQDTVAFLYSHHATGVTVAPPPRNAHAPGALAASAAMHSHAQHAQHPGATQAASAARLAEQANKAEVAKTLQVFSWFYSRANQMLSRSYVSETVLHLKGYRFYGVHEEDFSLFILYTENVSVPALASYNKEILENVLRHNGGLIG